MLGVLHGVCVGAALLLGTYTTWFAVNGTFSWGDDPNGIGSKIAQAIVLTLGTLTAIGAFGDLALHAFRFGAAL